MELGLSNSLLPGDPRLIDHIVNEVKSQGIFDQFRKECIADVDTKPAYQNLRTRVESSVNSFLNKQTWRTDLNKNQLRETLRKHIHDAPYLEVGVERIVDQVVNPKIYSVFMPQIEDVVYKFMGIERPKSQRNGPCDLKDLLPKDLDPVSPESDRNSLKDVSLESMDENVAEVVNGDEDQPSVSNIEEEVEKIEKMEKMEKVEKVEKIEKIEKDEDSLPTEKESNEIENGESEKIDKAVVSSPTKAVLNSSFKSDDTNKTEEEEEESPVFEPIDIMNLNESNMSNDSHLSGISELTSHQSQSPDFTTEFSRDNFEYSNQDSQLSKVSSNSRLSIVTDFGFSNHASTPVLDTKEDSKSSKDNFKTGEEPENNKNSEFDFEVIKNKESSKASSSSKESSRDADYKESKSKEEYRSKSSRDKYESRSSRNKDRDRDRDSRRRHSSRSDKYSSSKSKDKNESDSQDSKESSSKYKESKPKEIEKKGDVSKEVKEKDLYKEKIRELQKKKEMTEKEKLNKEKESAKTSKDSSRDKNDSSSSRERDEKKSHKSSSSSSKSSAHHNSRSSKSSESKESREKSSSGKREERRYSDGKNDSKSSSRSKRESRSDSKSESRSRDRSKKRREEKKSKSTDDHSSLRKNSNDRRSTDRDGSNGSSSKYSNKNSYSANNTSGKLEPSASLTKDSNKDSSGEASDNVYDCLQVIGSSDNPKNSSSYSNSENPPKRVDPGLTEICLPLKKRRLHNDESTTETSAKKIKLDDKKALKRKIEKDIFKLDVDVASVPDDERVQIIEIPDEDYDEYTYPSEEPILSIEDTKKIILDADPVQPAQPNLSEMEKSIRQSLSEMMADHGMIQTEEVTASSKTATSEMEKSIHQSLSEMMTDHGMIQTEEVSASPKATTSVMDSNTLLEALTDESEPSLLENTDVLNSANMEKVTEPVSEEDEEMIENMEKYMREESLKLNESLGTLKEIETTSAEVEKQLLEDNNNKVEKEKHESISNENEISKDVNIAANKIDIHLEEEDLATVDGNIIENQEKSLKKLSEEKNEQSVENKIEEPENYTKKIIENLDNNDDVSTDNTDEFNEDHKLVIDEEFDEKEVDQAAELDQNVSSIEKPVQCEKLQTDDNFVDCSSSKAKDEEEESNVDNNLINADENELHESDESGEVDLLKEKVEEKTPSDIITLEDSNDNDNDKEELDQENENESDEKSTEFTENSPEQIQNQLIDELGKLNENVNDLVEIGKIIEKSVQDDECSNDTNDEKIIVDPNAKSEDEDSEKENVTSLEEKETVEKDSDSDVKILEFKESGDIVEKESNSNDVDENSSDKDTNLIVICEPKDENNREELTMILNENSNKSSKTEASPNLEKDPIDIATTISDIEEEESRPEHTEVYENPSTSSEDKEANRTVIVTSPIEEDCIYLECDNKTYLTFKRYLEKLESESKKKANDSSKFESNIKEEMKAEPSNEEVSKDESEEKEEFEHKKQEEMEIESNKQKEIKVESMKEEEMKVELKKKKETIAESKKKEEVKVKTKEEEDTKMESMKEENIKIEPKKDIKVEARVKSTEDVKLAAPMPAPIAPRAAKRKLSTSPETEIFETNTASNKDDGSKTEPSTKASIAKESTESEPSVSKKRKVGRTKKISTSSSSSSSSTSAISPQQQPTAAVNGENFVMPLSPESDVSATSDKNSASAVKEEKTRQRSSQRSSQRYSSDDLYKPRPLFTSSSRRNRRFNPA